MTGSIFLTTVYGRFVKGWATIFLVVPYISLIPMYLYHKSNQPHQELENAYWFILAKRAASCEYQKGVFKAKELFGQFPKESSEVKSYLQSSGKTLYHLESEIVESIMSGKIK